MKLSIPYFNRKRYIVLKCYTPVSYFKEYCPIAIGSEAECPVRINKEHQFTRSFRTCYGRLAALKRSATVLMPSSLSIEVKEDLNTYYQFSEYNDLHVTLSFDHDTDPYYSSKDSTVSKLIMPWMLQEDTGVNFIIARHLRNTSHMMIPSAVLGFKHQHGTNVFNLIRKVPHKYTVDFRTPLVSLYPQSDKPLYVESYYDVSKFRELYEKAGINSWFTGSSLKLHKLMVDNE